MFTTDQLLVATVVISLVVAGFSLWKSYQANNVVTLTGVVDEIKSAEPIAKQILEVVQIGVNAAEQLKREGKLATNDDALNYALDYAKQWLPKEWNLSNHDIIEAINAAVLVSSALACQAGSSSRKQEF
jgi:hypothetical protein